MRRAMLAVAAMFVAACAEDRPQAGGAAAPVPTAPRPAAAPAAAEPRSVAAKVQPPAAGQLAPDFTLPDHSGDSVTLAAARGEKAVLVFYRGHW